MAKHKGQVSVEFSLTLAVQLFIIALLIVVFSGIFSQFALRASDIVARDSVGGVADAAKAVHSQGAGAVLQVQISIPESSYLNQSYIGNNTIDLYLSGYGDVSAAVPFAISGNWPNRTGPALVEVENNGSSVLVRPALAVFANSSVLYFAINKTANPISTLSVRLRNRMGVQYNVTPSFYCQINCSIAPYQIYALSSPQYYEDISVTVNASSSLPGLYAGYINFSAVADAPYPADTFVLPLTSRVYT